MEKGRPNREVLVCGLAPAAQLRGRLALLDEPISLRVAHTPDALRAELARGRQAVCVIEHEIAAVDPTADIERLAAAADAGTNDDADDNDAEIAALAAKIRFRDSGLTACGLLSELITLSAHTKFVVTCHKRYAGATTTLRRAYAGRPQVIKVLGSLAEWGNVTYLLKLLSRTYLGKSWKPSPASEGLGRA